MKVKEDNEIKQENENQEQELDMNHLMQVRREKLDELFFKYFNFRF